MHKSPPSNGKSSLLVRYMAEGKAVGKRPILIDFQSFSEGELADFPTLLSGLAQIMSRRFKVLSQANLSFSNQRDFTNFLEDRLLAGIAEPVVFGFDEADRLLGRPYQSDFFSMLRLWHNERARPASPWEKSISLW